MSRIPLLLLLSFLTLGGCSQQSGTGGNGGGPGGGGSNDPDPTNVFPSSGIPDQDSFTVAVQTLNPRGRDFVNTIVPITVLLADQLGNNSTIPDGTQVYFAAHGGAIETSGQFCTTTNGACSVNWRSQNPIPNPGPEIVDPLGSGEMVVSYSSGRATVLAWTEGIESFIDNNSNGLFDDAGAQPDVQIDDVGDPFLDRNGNGVRDANEEFVDFPIPQLGTGGTYTSPDGLYSGPNCSHSNLCATGLNAQSLFIFQNVKIAMSSDEICIVDVGARVAGPPDYYPSTIHPGTTLTTGVRFRFRFLIHDCYGNPPMSGTTITFSSDVGILRGPTSFTVPNTTVDMGGTPNTDPLGKVGIRQRYPSNSLVYFIDVEGETDNSDPESGVLEVNVSAPVGDGGYTSVNLFDPMN